MNHRMNPLKQKNRIFFFIAVLFLLMLIVQVVLYGRFFSDLKSGTEVINDLSRIRGYIQRYTKLELADMRDASQDFEGYIDSLIARNMDLSSETELSSIYALYDMKVLNAKWDSLKLLVRNYHIDPREETLLDIIRVSEKCWEVADVNVVRHEYLVYKTAAYFRYFIVTFGINLFIIVLLLLYYKRYIHRSLASSAIQDTLTGVFNKGYFSAYLDYEIARAQRKHTTFSLIMLDIDNFKNVNDTYGHRRGDYALKTLVEVVKKDKRNADVLARIGGEEFIILLPDTKLSNASLLAERIRRNIEEYPFEEIGKLTVSFGATEFTPSDNSDSILRRVDSALYLAKENGKNRCEALRGEEHE